MRAPLLRTDRTVPSCRLVVRLPPADYAGSAQSNQIDHPKTSLGLALGLRLAVAAMMRAREGQEAPVPSLGEMPLRMPELFALRREGMGPSPEAKQLPSGRVIRQSSCAALAHF